MIHHKDYVAGWIAGSVRIFLRAFPEGSNKLNYALLSCLDSDVNVVSLLQSTNEFRPLVDAGRALGNGLLVPAKRLLEANAAHRLFFGFDEVWFFPTEEVRPKPKSVSLVGPHRITPQVMTEIGGWMESNSCALALGDGEGLNFIIKARGLVKHLLSLSLEQPEPTLRDTFEEEPWNPEQVQT